MEIIVVAKKKDECVERIMKCNKRNGIVEFGQQGWKHQATVGSHTLMSTRRRTCVRIFHVSQNTIFFSLQFSRHHHHHSAFVHNEAFDGAERKCNYLVPCGLSNRQHLFELVKCEYKMEILFSLGHNGSYECWTEASIYLFLDIFSSVNLKTFDRDHLVCWILLIMLMMTLAQHQPSFNHFTNGTRTTHHQMSKVRTPHSLSSNEARSIASP